MSRHLTRHFYV